MVQPYNGAYSKQPMARDQGSSPALPLSKSGLLVQRLYKHKVEHMIRDTATTLATCTQCGEVFAAAYRHRLNCESVGADPTAAAFRRHIPDKSWKAQRHVPQPLAPLCTTVTRRTSQALHITCCAVLLQLSTGINTAGIVARRLLPSHARIMTHCCACWHWASVQYVQL